MSWQISSTLMVRAIIGDMDETNQKYSDSRIQQAVVISGLIASQEYPFATTYTFNIVEPSISPDPSSDSLAMALFTLRAACMLDTNSYSDTVSNSVNVEDGDTVVKTTDSFGGWRDIIKIGACGSYQKLLQRSLEQASMAAGRAITSPMTHEDFLRSGNGFVVEFFDSLGVR